MGCATFPLYLRHLALTIPAPRYTGLAMRTRKFIGPDGKQYNAVELSFQNVREHWNEYLLDDGTILKLKPVATEVLRVEDAYDDNGNPVYILTRPTSSW